MMLVYLSVMLPYLAVLGRSAAATLRLYLKAV
jgi:hypothetical protein